MNRAAHFVEIGLQSIFSYLVFMATFAWVDKSIYSLIDVADPPAFVEPETIDRRILKVDLKDL